MEYLRVVFDTQREQIHLTSCKISKIIFCIQRGMKTPPMSTKDRMVLVEMFTAAVQVVPWAGWHIIDFKVAFLSQWNRPSMDQNFSLPAWNVTWIGERRQCASLGACRSAQETRLFCCQMPEFKAEGLTKYSKITYFWDFFTATNITRNIIYKSTNVIHSLKQTWMTLITSHKNINDSVHLQVVC